MEIDDICQVKDTTKCTNDLQDCLSLLEAEKRREDRIGICKALDSLVQAFENLRQNVNEQPKESYEIANEILNKHFMDVLNPILTNAKSKSKDRRNVLFLLSRIVAISTTEFGRQVLTKMERLPRAVLDVMEKSQSQSSCFLYFFFSFFIGADFKIIELLIGHSEWFFDFIARNLRNFSDEEIKFLLLKLKEVFLNNRMVKKQLKLDFFKEIFVQNLLLLLKEHRECSSDVFEFLQVLCSTNKGIAFVFQKDSPDDLRSNYFLKKIIFKNVAIFDRFWCHNFYAKLLLKIAENCLDLTKEILVLAEEDFIEASQDFDDLQKFFCEFFASFPPLLVHACSSNLAAKKKILAFYKSSVMLNFLFCHLQSKKIRSTSVKFKLLNVKLILEMLMHLQRQADLLPASIAANVFGSGDARDLQRRFPTTSMLLELWQVSIEQLHNGNEDIDGRTLFEYFDAILEIIICYTKLDWKRAERISALCTNNIPKSLILSVDFVPSLDSNEKLILVKKLIQLFLSISEDLFLQNDNELLTAVLDMCSFDVNVEILNGLPSLKQLNLDVWLKYFQDDGLFKSRLVELLRQPLNLKSDGVYFSTAIIRGLSSESQDPTIVERLDYVLFELYFKSSDSMYSTILADSCSFYTNLISTQFFDFISTSRSDPGFTFKNIKDFFEKNGPRAIKKFLSCSCTSRAKEKHIGLFFNLTLYVLINYRKIETAFFQYALETIEFKFSSITIDWSLLAHLFETCLNQLINGDESEWKDSKKLLKFIVEMFKKKQKLDTLANSLFETLRITEDTKITSIRESSLALLFKVASQLRLHASQIDALCSKCERLNDCGFRRFFADFVLQQEHLTVDTKHSVTQYRKFFNDMFPIILSDQRFTLNCIKYFCSHSAIWSFKMRLDEVQKVFATLDLAHDDPLFADIEAFCSHILSNNLVDDDNDCEQLLPCIEQSDRLFCLFSTHSSNVSIKRSFFQRFKDDILSLSSNLIQNEYFKTAVRESVRVVDDVQFFESFLLCNQLDSQNIEVYVEIAMRWFILNCSDTSRVFQNENNLNVHFLIVELIERIVDSDSADEEKILFEHLSKLVSCILSHIENWSSPSSDFNEIKLTILRSENARLWLDNVPSSDFVSSPNRKPLFELLNKMASLLLMDSNRTSWFKKFSPYLQQILSKDFDCSETQVAYLEILLKCVSGVETKVLKVSHLEHLLAAYTGTLSNLDQILLIFIQKFEEFRIEKCEPYFTHFLWSSLAESYHLLLKSNRKDVISQPPMMLQIMNSLDCNLIESTIENFPKSRDFSVLQTMNVQSYNPSSVYDPVFYLCYFSNLLGPRTRVHVTSFIQSGALALTFVSLSSYQKDIRNLAIKVLEQFKVHLDSFLEKNSNFLLWSNLIYSVIKGLQCEKNEHRRANNISAIFLAKSCQIAFSTSHALHKQICYFLNGTKCFDLLSVPSFLSLFRGTKFVLDAETKEKAKLFILNVIAVGIVDKTDVQAIFYGMIYKKLLDSFLSASHNCQLLILEILIKTANFPFAAKTLLHRFGIVEWVHEIKMHMRVAIKISNEEHLSDSQIDFGSINKFDEHFNELIRKVLRGSGDEEPRLCGSVDLEAEEHVDGYQSIMANLF